MGKHQVCVVLFLLLTAAQTPAQVSTGEVSGIITDTNGGAVPNATVTATSAERGISRTATTATDGSYRITLLPPGTYTLRVAAQGFATRILSDVGVQVGETVNLNATLEVGAVTTELTVTALVPVVETERTQQS